MPTYSVPLHVTASAIRRRIMMSAPPGNGYVIQSDSTANEGYSWVLLGGGGGGTTNHAALSNLGWTYSGHTHTGTGIAGFNGAGAAIVYGYGTAGGVAAYNTTVASFGALTPVEGKWLGYSSGALTWSTPTAAVDWVTFVGQASNPGGASTTSTLYMSDGTEYDVGTLVWSRKTVFRGALSIGEPGTEQADIVLGGVTYTVPAKVNAFGTARAGCVLHQHSNTVEPDLVFARARGTTSSHTIVQDTDIFGRVIFGGWLNSTIGYARGAEIRAHADGTVSTTSMPTRIDFATCGSGATSVTDRWCILPNGTFRPAADNTYQIGNTSYALTEAWARQWMLLEQAAVTAPAGGWAGRSGFWAKSDTPTVPIFTDDAGTDNRLQYWDADLAALAANATNGLWARTGAGTGSARTVTAGTGITVTNGDGVGGNPTVAVTAATATTSGLVVETDFHSTYLSSRPNYGRWGISHANGLPGEGLYANNALLGVSGSIAFLAGSGAVRSITTTTSARGVTTSLASSTWTAAVAPGTHVWGRAGAAAVAEAAFGVIIGPVTALAPSNATARVALIAYNGAFYAIAADGTTSNNVTISGVTPANNVTYTLEIRWLSSSSVWFYVRDIEGAILGSQELTTNIPTSSGVALAHGWVGWHTVTTATTLYLSTGGMVWLP